MKTCIHMGNIPASALLQSQGIYGGGRDNGGLVIPTCPLCSPPINRHERRAFTAQLRRAVRKATR
jgi:hypothetical protein